MFGELATIHKARQGELIRLLIRQSLDQSPKANQTTSTHVREMRHVRARERV